MQHSLLRRLVRSVFDVFSTAPVYSQTTTKTAISCDPQARPAKSFELVFCSSFFGTSRRPDHKRARATPEFFSSFILLQPVEQANVCTSKFFDSFDIPRNGDCTDNQVRPMESLELLCLLSLGNFDSPVKERACEHSEYFPTAHCCNPKSAARSRNECAHTRVALAKR